MVQVNTPMECSNLGKSQEAPPSSFQNIFMPSLQYNYSFHALMIKSSKQAQQGYIKSQKRVGMLRIVCTHLPVLTVCLFTYTCSLLLFVL